MPLYEYECTECKVRQEHLMKFSDPTPGCTSCGLSEHMEKQISTGTGFCLMGYGWDRPGMSVGKK